MNFRSFLVLFAIVVAATVPQATHAGLVTSVSSSNNAVAQVTGISNASYTHVANGIGTGGITVDLNVFQLHTPIQLSFTYAARAADPLVTDYTVTLRVTNSIPTTSGGLNFKGFDLTNNGVVSGDVLSAGLRGVVPITSDTFVVEYFGALNIPSGFRWGGLAGGGATLAPGGTAVNTFVQRISWAGSAAGTSRLNFVANPEPTTLLLGSLLMAPAVWVARRKRQASGSTEPTL